MQSRWTCTPEPLPGGCGWRYAPAQDGRPLTWADMLDGWADDADHRTTFDRWLADAPPAGYRWETTPVTATTTGRPFEFVLLAAAGFVARPANTPERQQMLAGLPPGRIVSHPEGDHLSYLFADPLDCRCLYVGGPQEWTRYQQTLQQQRIANAQVEAAQLNYGAFGWGPWGGGFGPGFY